MRRRKSVVLAATAVLAGGLGLFASTGAATAVTGHTSGSKTKASYDGQCGKGYKVVKKGAVGDAGTVYLAQNLDNPHKRSCVVTVRHKSGDPIQMSASIEDRTHVASKRSGTRDEGPTVDSGKFREYAGPVYMGQRCVDFEGEIEGESYGEHKVFCDS